MVSRDSPCSLVAGCWALYCISGLARFTLATHVCRHACLARYPLLALIACWWPSQSLRELACKPGKLHIAECNSLVQGGSMQGWISCKVFSSAELLLVNTPILFYSLHIFKVMHGNAKSPLYMVLTLSKTAKNALLLLGNPITLCAKIGLYLCLVW